MNLRAKEIYVSGKTKRRLFWLSKIESEKHTEPHILTVDEIADRLLNEKIEQDYPQMKALEKRLNALEDQLVSELLSPSASADTPTDA